MLKLARSGSSVADNLKRAHDLYRQKDAKGCDFVYEHCWLLVRDNPRWALGWAQEKPSTPTRSWGEGSEQELPEPADGSMSKPSSAAGSGSGLDSEVADCTQIFKGRPGGTKATKDEVSRSKMREGGLYAQAATTYKMAEAQMLKAVGLADQNLLLLMTTDDTALVNAEAREYVQLQRVQELRKLKLQMATEEAAETELQLEANRTRKRAMGVQGSGDSGEPPPKADQLAEETEE